MYQIFFEGVRCFYDLQTCPIKPITLLVGENSTGKTTFLALTRIAWDIIEGSPDKDIFNEEPFMLGSYDQIANFRGGRAGRAKSFMVGMQLSINSAKLTTNNAKISARFIQHGSQSELDEWSFEYDKFKLIAKSSARQTDLEITINTTKGVYKLSDISQISSKINSRALLYIFMEPTLFGHKYQEIESDLEYSGVIHSMAKNSANQRPYAFAPIRTKPQRTYDPIKTVYDPEGSHVPMILNKILTDGSKEGERLREALSFFGETSGLFKKIEAKRKGNKDSDPFQIGVKTTGPSFNLIDVGYGVSQALPLIVDIVLNPPNSTFLLQQPEVHLHPKAQAGLASFLAYSAKEQNKRFVIETHSDYIIDRVRMDVRDKKYITPDDVAILYFEKTQGNVKIHELNLDEYGNIINAPPTYRQFFLEEERKMLGI